MAEDGSRESHAEEKRTYTNKVKRSDVVDDLETGFRALNLDDSNKRTSEPDYLKEEREKDQQGKTSVIAEETGRTSAGPDGNKEAVRKLPVGSRATTSDTEQNLGADSTAASTEGNSEIPHSPSAGPNSSAGANGDSMHNPSDVPGIDGDKNTSSVKDQGTEPECTKSEDAQHPYSHLSPATDTTGESDHNSSAELESDNLTANETETSQSAELDLATNTAESAPKSDSEFSSTPQTQKPDPKFEQVCSAEPSIQLNETGQAQPILALKPSNNTNDNQNTDDFGDDNVTRQISENSKRGVSDESTFESGIDSSESQSANGDSSKEECGHGKVNTGDQREKVETDISCPSENVSEVSKNDSDSSNESLQQPTDSVYTSDPLTDNTMGSLICSSGKKTKPDDGVEGTEHAAQSETEQSNTTTMNKKRGRRSRQGGQERQDAQNPLSTMDGKSTIRGELSTPEAQKKDGRTKDVGQKRNDVKVNNSYTIECLEIEKLKALGFKSHCEQKYDDPMATLEFDLEARCIYIVSTFNYSEVVEKEMEIFCRDVSSFLVADVLVNNFMQQLFEKSEVQQCIMNELCSKGIGCFFSKEKDGLQCSCMSKQENACRDDLSNFATYYQYQSESLETVKHVQTMVDKEQFALFEVTPASERGFCLHIAVDTRVAPKVVKGIKKSIGISPEKTTTPPQRHSSFGRVSTILSAVETDGQRHSTLDSGQVQKAQQKLSQETSREKNEHIQVHSACSTVDSSPPNTERRPRQHSRQMTGGSGQHPTQMTRGSGQHSTQMTGGSGQHSTQMTGGSGQHSTQMTGGSGQHTTQVPGQSGKHTTQMAGGPGQHSTQMTGGPGQHSSQMTGGPGQHSSQMTGGPGQHSSQMTGGPGQHSSQMTGGPGQHSSQMTGGPGQHSSQMTGGPGQHSSQMTGGPGQHSSQMPGGPGQHSSQMTGGPGQHSSQMTGGSGQHSSQMTGGPGQHSSQMTRGSGQHSSQMPGGPGQHSSQMTGGPGQHSSQMTGGSGQHSSQMPGGPGQHSSQMTGGPGQHSSQMTGGPGQHSSQMTGGPGQHSSQMTGGPGQHSSQMTGGSGQHSSQMTGGPGQHSSQMPGGPGQHSSQMTGGSGQHSSQMPGGPGQHSSQMTGGPGQHSSQMPGGPGQHSSQMPGGPGQHSSQMPGGPGQHSSQMPGGPGQHSSQMTGEPGQHSSQMTRGSGQHSSQMPGGPGQHSSQMPGGPGQHSSQMPGGPGQHSSQMPGGPGQHTTQMLGGPEQRTSQHITQYRAQLSGGPNYHGDKDMVGKQIALPESDPIVELLRKNERLRDKITISLLSKGIQIDVEDIKRGVIAVKQGNENSLQTVYKVLQEYVEINLFPDTVVEENLSKDDFSFLDKDLSIFCHHVMNGQMWTLVHSTDIFERLQPVLWKLWYKEIKIPLPGYLLSHVPVFKNKLALQGWVECFSLTEEDGQGYLTVSVEQTRAQTVKEDIFCWLETLMFRQQPVCKTTGHILQSRAQSEWNTQDSTILVQTPDRHVLLHAWSPNGHQLILCVDDMKEPDADLMVIPLSHEQKEWSTNKPFLNTAFGSTPSEMKTLHLTISSGQLKDKKVALLRVPSNRDNKLKDKIWTALKEVLKSTASNTTVAIPLHMIPNSDVGKSAKVILHGIVESLQEGLGPTQGLVLKLYLEPGMMTDDLDFVNFDEHLTKNNWITSGSLKTRGTSCDRVRVVVEDFLKLQADVFVNSTDPQLNHVHGTVSKLLLKKAGQALEQQCHQLYRHGMAGNVVAVSDSFGAKNVKKIFHIALPQDLWPEQGGKTSELENSLLQTLTAHVHSCLTRASANRFESIIFPSLGTGNLKYPPHRVAQTMFSAIEDFFKEMPKSSLKDVYICCHEKDIKVIQAFWSEDITRTFGVCTPWHTAVGGANSQGARVSVEVQGGFLSYHSSVSLVHIVEADALACSYPKVDLLICSNSQKPEIWKRFQAHQTFCGVADSKQKEPRHEVKTALLKARNMETVLIFLDTFDEGHFSGVLQGVSKGLAKPLSVILVVSADKFDTVFEAAKKEWGDMKKYPARGPGKGATQPLTNSSVVQVCGQKEQVENVLKKITELDKSKRQDSPVDPQPGQKTSKADKDLEGAHDRSGSDSSHSEEPSGHYTLPVPLECLQKEDLDTFLKQMSHFKPQVHKNSPVPSVQFCLKTIEEWESALEKVHEYIREHGKTRKPESSLSHLQQQSQDQGHSVLTRELPSVVAGALKVLMKEDFGKVKEEQIDNDKVKLSCSGPGPAQDIMNKMDSLRQEEMQLGPEDMQKISAPMDTSEEGVAAYMVPVPQQGKVIIFSFDYNAVSKAKHLLNVKLGKVKVTARARRRFEGKNDSGGDEASSHSPPSSLGHKSSTANAAEFNTKSGIKVSVYKTDITKLPVDAIVNAANENLAHGGGVAYAISRAAGFELEDDGQNYIKKHGPLKVKAVVATTAGSLPCEKVLHAVGPRWSDYKDKALCQQHLVDTVYNCLIKADTMQLTSLAIPSISAAIFGVPKEVCAEGYLSAVQSFDKDCGRDTSVRHVHFVDVNDDMINTVQETFKQHWNTDMSSKRQEVGKGSAPAAAQQDLMSSNTGSHSIRNSGSRQTPAEFGDGLSSVGKNTLHPEEKTKSMGLEVHTNNRGEIEYRYYSQDLALLFKCQNVTEPYTDILVLWQEIGNLAKDEDFRQYKATLSTTAQDILSRFTSNMTSAGYVYHVELDARVVLFPVVSSYSALTAEKVQEMVASCLDKVGWFHKASVAIPTYPRTLKDSKEPKLAGTNFVVGLFKAVKNFSKTPKSVKQIHVISPDKETIQFVTETVSQKLAIIKSRHDIQPSVSGSGQAEPVTEDCVICHYAIKEPKALKCGHTFCTECVDKWLREKSRCPTCKRVHGTLIGNQPSNGRMEMRFSVSAIPGYEEWGSLVINYSFNDGIQTAKHPQPGKRYWGISRTAYLPNTREGRTVLMLLKTAFDRLLIFTVDRSSTTGNIGIIWNDIHHKTSQFGGTTKHGYPDPKYLMRVTMELADQGVMEENLTDIQKDFIEKPEKFFFGNFDFSYRFKLPSSTGTTV